MAMDVLIEIGTEEMPASAVYEGISQVERLLPSLLEGSRLGLRELRVLGTPRRLSAIATGVPERASSEVVKKKGPPLTVARREDGSWSEPAVKFAESQGVRPDELVVEEAGKGSYLFAVTELPGEPAEVLLPGILQELTGSIRFKKSMRWGAGEARFSRPVRWIVALADSKTIEFEFGEVSSGRWTRGHRYLSEGWLEIADPGSYQPLLEENRVMADQSKRLRAVLQQAEDACGREGMVPVIDEDVLGEVVQLVEWPGVVLGEFDPGFLRIPGEILVHAMEEHQRYFPVEDGKGDIQARFLAVHNGEARYSQTIERGHQRVLAARLADAEFFLSEDLKRPLSDRLGDLEHVVYQSELGSMAEKTERLAVQVAGMGEELGLEKDFIDRAREAAQLAKCDLVTNMVVEFPALQGVVGSIYAREQGLDDRVAAALAEQYLPRRTGDELPSTTEGALLSLAEKADNLAASFGLGHVPTGSEDPYALRRQALGIVSILLERGFPLSVSGMVERSAAELEAEAHGFSYGDRAAASLEEFFKGRERVFFTERGYRYDLVESVLEVDWDSPLTATKRLDALASARDEGLLERLYTAFERCHNLSKGEDRGDVDEELLVEGIEKDVHSLSGEVEEHLDEALDRSDFDAALKALEPICRPVDVLFDEVLIMAEDESIRENRLSLIAAIAGLFNRIADFKTLTWD